ncbi:hypothetical protein DOE78_15110 [Bacillus sp. Y1]|jgi:hypothetical protein|uniref:hypothetical protein n=1 Tax=Robertmurraya sp. TaxID=2837525 RepID=UPI000E6B425E|nr:hypothetical protein [Bacillus sp. Y1]AYA76663.1 hypothetical protein DOE78_15110 [Bacillus sp. Y1]
MLRTIIAGIGGFFLVFMETFLVMKLKGWHSIEIGGIAPFVSVWSMNFFLLFTMLSHAHLWYEKVQNERNQAQPEGK